MGGLPPDAGQKRASLQEDPLGRLVLLGVRHAHDVVGILPAAKLDLVHVGPRGQKASGKRSVELEATVLHGPGPPHRPGLGDLDAQVGVEDGVLPSVAVLDPRDHVPGLDDAEILAHVGRVSLPLEGLGLDAPVARPGGSHPSLLIVELGDRLPVLLFPIALERRAPLQGVEIPHPEPDGLQRAGILDLEPNVDLALVGNDGERERHIDRGSLALSGQRDPGGQEEQADQDGSGRHAPRQPDGREKACEGSPALFREPNACEGRPANPTTA